MTDLEFATCNLEQFNEVYNTKRKKFSELQIGDPIYCVVVEMKPPMRLFLPKRRFEKFELEFKKIILDDPTNPKGRKAKIFLTDTHGFIADKNVSAFIRYKRIYKGDIFIQIYGTSLEECIFKAEKTTGLINLETKLVWTKPIF